MEKNRTIRAIGSALAISLLVVLSGLAVRSAGGQTRGDPVILVVGVQDKMKTRNPLPAMAGDVWTQDVLDRVYDTFGKALPETKELVPYILKGVDANDDGIFEENEYGEFAKQGGGDQLNITAYYDVNGVYFHDGIQATPGDLFFSYQLQAMNPRSNVDLRVLMDKAGRSGSNYSTARWLFVTPTVKNWQNEPQVGNSSLRFAVRYQLQEPFALFYNRTLAEYILFPRHVWEDRGFRDDTTSAGCTMQTPCRIDNLHADFGKAIYPESSSKFGQGIPTPETIYKPYVYLKSDTPAIDSAEEWQLTDADVIGTGPFRFVSFDEAQAVALVMKNTLFFAGKDEKTGVMIDPAVAAYINQPFIDGITFRVYVSTTLCLLALESWGIDYCHIGIPPEFVPELTRYWDIRIWSQANPSFTFLGYNMRDPSVGKWDWGQGDEFDVGYHFRKAVAHLIEKSAIIRIPLSGYGMPGIVPISPDNTAFYNESLKPYELNLTLAQQELDLAHADAVWLAANGGPPEAGSWFTRDPFTGQVIMPEIGLDEFSITCVVGFTAVWGDDNCELIVEWMWAFGFNVRIRPFWDYGIINTIQMHDFDMFVAGWNIASEDPDFLFDFFHSSNAAAGLNYVGFNDPLMDRVLEDSRREINWTRRVELLKWAQGIIADKLPYDTLYFRTNIEATNQGRFVGWKSLVGTVWNFWSLLNIRPPSRLRLHVSIESPSAVAAGEAVSLSVRVRNQDGEPIDGATIRVTIAPTWAGNLSAGGIESGNDITAMGSLGKLVLIYTAPSASAIYNVTITATAAHLQYPETPEASRSLVIVVYPAAAKFLGVTIRFLDTDIVPSFDTIWFEVSVTDRDGFGVPDSQATAVTSPSLEPPYGIDPFEWNGSTTSRLRFRAPPGNSMAANRTPIILTVRADSPNDGKGNASVVFLILRLFKSCPDGTTTLLDESCSSQVEADGYMLVALVTLAGVGLAVVVSVAIENARMRRDISGKKR
jgi:ABC-type transport system substrate-binding protein